MSPGPEAIGFCTSKRAVIPGSCRPRPGTAPLGSSFADHSGPTATMGIAWLGASWATRMSSATLFKVIAVLLVVIAVVLLFGHEVTETQRPACDGWALFLAGALAGLAIGIIASVMGVAGGELLIPTFVLLFGLDIKLA